MVETEYFRISPQRYVRTAIGVWMGRYGWIGLIIIAGFITAGIADARYFIVAAALALIAYPGVLMLVYFNHALTKEAAYGLIPHKILLTDTELTIVYAESEEHPTPPSQTIGTEELARAENTGSILKITPRMNPDNVILIPNDAFLGDDLHEAIRILSENG